MQSVKDLTLHDSAKLLLQLSRPDEIFMQGLKCFTHKTIIGAVHNDKIVPFASSCLLRSNIHPKLKQAHYSIVAVSGFDESYVDHFCQFPMSTSELNFNKEVELQPLENVEEKLLPGGFLYDDAFQVKFLPEIYNNLIEVPWRRILIHFPSLSQFDKMITHQSPLAIPSDSFQVYFSSLLFLFRP